jgi:hypothetical protein
LLPGEAWWVEKMLFDNLWFAIPLAVISYVVGYFLAVNEAYLYYGGANNRVVLDGLYELAPALQEVEFKGRRITARVVAEMVVLGLAVFGVWVICYQQINRPDLFSFLIGGVVLLEAAAGMHHFRNIVFFHYAQKAEGIRGKIEYSRRLVHTLSFFELYGFAALYLLMFLV